MKNTGTSLLKFLGSALILLALAGCEINANNTKIQYMPDMADAPTVKAQEGYLDPPDGSIPITGILYPKDIATAEKLLKNPFPVSDKIVADGKVLFNIFCIACHGADAKGKHALGPAFPGPPDITDAMYKEKGDGFFFHKITFGGPIMPSLGHAVSPHERWKIIHYLRTLQE